VLLPDTDESGAATIAERIRQAVLQLSMEHCVGVSRVVTVSAGVASVVGGPIENGRGALVQATDRALYLAKGAGRNTVARASSLSATPITTPSTAARREGAAG